jgi:hypothetical protein
MRWPQQACLMHFSYVFTVSFDFWHCLHILGELSPGPRSTSARLSFELIACFEFSFTVFILITHVLAWKRASALRRVDNAAKKYACWVYFSHYSSFISTATYASRCNFADLPVASLLWRRWILRPLGAPFHLSLRATSRCRMQCHLRPTLAFSMLHCWVS